MTKQDADQFVEFARQAVEGIGDTLATKHSEVVMTCVIAVLALAKQPSIDLPKLISDMEHLVQKQSDPAPVEVDASDVRPPVERLIELLRLQLGPDSR